ncbi:hypothetical protein C5706_33250, partial [Klebsiella pneumoniae]
MVYLVAGKNATKKRKKLLAEAGYSADKPLARELRAGMVYLVAGKNATKKRKKLLAEAGYSADKPL